MNRQQEYTLVVKINSWLKNKEIAMGAKAEEKTEKYNSKAKINEIEIGVISEIFSFNHEYFENFAEGVAFMKINKNVFTREITKNYIDEYQQNRLIVEAEKINFADLPFSPEEAKKAKEYFQTTTLGV